jgi:hypothetical protein
MHTTEIQQMLAEWEQVGEQLKQYEGELMPLARERSRAALASYRAGRGDLRPALEAYEQEIEFMGQGATPYFNRRRVDGLLSGTPRQMPVPAKELAVLTRAVYTFGGPTGPDMTAAAGGAVGRETVRDRYEQTRATRGSALTRWLAGGRVSRF